MSLPNRVVSSVNILSDILNEIGAAEYLQVFIDDDRDDDSIKTLAHFSVERIATKYGMPPDVAAAFSDKCRSTFIPPALPVSAVDNVAIMRSLNLEIMQELGRGGFGVVYQAKNLVDRLKVAVKIVKDPQNAVQAIREGQRLRRAKHKHIVSMYKVHDLGDGSCALEMELVPGGDLSQHLEACRRRPHARLPHDAALRFSRQLLEALVYLHNELKWLHGDIKPQNILMQCNPVPADGSDVDNDYSSAEIKLADFGLSKILDQESATPSLVLSTMAGVLKGTMMYLSPEAFGGGCERSAADDLWSACLVIFEMDTGLSIQQLMTAPGSVNIEVLLTKSSPDLLPLLCCVLLAQSRGSRCGSAVELLRMLDASTDPLFVWQFFDPVFQRYVSVPPASFVFLEAAFLANEPLTGLPLPPPLDLVFDIHNLLSSSTALGFQTEKRSGKKYRIRRVMKPFLSSSQSIPTWQELVDGKEWVQCSPAACAKLDVEVRNPNGVIDAARYRQLSLDSGSMCDVQLPHPLKIEPYLTPAHASDIAMLNMRLHDSLPEWDVTAMEQVVNAALASRYAAYRYRVAAHCNGNPNERIMFHFANPAVMTKIWQDGEGHDPRLSNWAEVGKGAYFSAHLMYGYAYKYGLWPSPPKFEVKPEPPIGETMQVFASLVCLGNVADMGPGCETCPSPAWDAWKKEPPILPKPTRPPAMTLSADAAEKQHILDLTQVKDVPRYDSVKSTEGELGTHPASTNKDASGRRICDIMHPRLRPRAKEWAEQCVLFEAAAAYPLFIVTLTKTRDSPMGPQALIDAGCDANRIKVLGFTASHIMALSKNAREMRNAGWSISELKDAGFDLRSLFETNCKLSDLRSGGFNARQFMDSGFNLPKLKEAGFMPCDLLPEGFNIQSLLELYTLNDMNKSKVPVRDLKAAGQTCEALYMQGKFAETDLRAAGFSAHELDRLLSPLRLRRLGYTAVNVKELGYSDKEIENAGYLNFTSFFPATADLCNSLKRTDESDLQCFYKVFGWILTKTIVAGFTVFGYFYESNSNWANVGMWLFLGAFVVFGYLSLVGLLQFFFESARYSYSSIWNFLDLLGKVPVYLTLFLVPGIL